MITSIADLVVFLKRFHRHWMDDPSLDPAGIPADLPDGLSTMYRELGALVELRGERGPFGTQDGLVALSRLKSVDGMIEFAYENQDCWSARCPLGEPDPPVYSNAPDLGEDEQRGFVVVCDSLNHFLTTLCLQEAAMSCDHLVAFDVGRPLNELISIPLWPMWLNGYYVDREPSRHFFVSPDEDVLVMETLGAVWVGSPVKQVAGLVVPGVRVTVLPR